MEVWESGGRVVPVGGRVWGERFDCLTCNVGVSCKMLSQMCGSLYCPKFLLSNGSFTSMNMVSFMFLEGLCFLVYDIEALWAEGMSCGTVVVVNGRGGLKVFYLILPMPCLILLCKLLCSLFGGS